MTGREAGGGGAVSSRHRPPCCRRPASSRPPRAAAHHEDVDFGPRENAVVPPFKVASNQSFRSALKSIFDSRSESTARPRAREIVVAIGATNRSEDAWGMSATRRITRYMSGWPTLMAAPGGLEEDQEYRGRRHVIAETERCGCLRSPAAGGGQHVEEPAFLAGAWRRNDSLRGQPVEPAAYVQFDSKHRGGRAAREVGALAGRRRTTGKEQDAQFSPGGRRVRQYQSWPPSERKLGPEAQGRNGRACWVAVSESPVPIRPCTRAGPREPLHGPKLSGPSCSERKWPTPRGETGRARPASPPRSPRAKYSPPGSGTTRRFP